MTTAWEQERVLAAEPVETWDVGPHHFDLFKVAEHHSDKKGRRLWLWMNGAPCYGGQWHYTVEGAHKQADFVTMSYKLGREAALKGEVDRLTADLRKMTEKADRRRDLMEGMQANLDSLRQAIDIERCLRLKAEEKASNPVYVVDFETRIDTLDRWYNRYSFGSLLGAVQPTYFWLGKEAD